ncbi:hypothetical protein TG4357_00900 [Thalassovita gelatinovora]|uniref:Argininosuccinate lyase n=1 Tax=Thalassovita gelatinovora TaxID=53501 RepID=A0A0P1F793_THAGE|nr:hypothetical protein [Thalassovita gelatinovora]QIZ82263.1 hypothetical protein HFZ77_18150 [Thalassovita gelatinovora]CUH63803.1 hypothetical protein TG4357_00900 [Thalassovita gelatinovora]SEQ97438.1 hypothetical protein SAMN04488043_11251 [Thalassovita gelatinovora]
MKTKLIAAIALVVAQMGATSSQAANRKVTIVNNSGYTIVEFQGSNVGANSWEEDILGNDVLEHGQKVDINFDDGTGYCKFDFLVTFDDGDQLTEKNFDVCSIGTFTID